MKCMAALSIQESANRVTAQYAPISTIYDTKGQPNSGTTAVIMAIVNEEKTSSATIWYLERSDLYKVEKPYQTTFDTAALGGPTDNLRFVDVEISVQDAQDDRERFSIDTHGFQFCRWPTSLFLHEFESDESLRSSYYLEIKQYVQQIRSGATHIQVMSHTVSTLTVELKPKTVYSCSEA